MATMAPIGRPRYNAGSSVDAVDASASGPPLQVVSATAPIATNDVISTALVDMAATPPNASDANDAHVSAAAIVEITVGTAKPLARAIDANSIHAITSRPSATNRNTSGGANHTTATAMSRRTAPLTTRVT